MALPRVGDTGKITMVDGAPLYNQLLGEIFRWEATINSDEFDASTFATTTTNVSGKKVGKGMYVVRGVLEGYWDTGNLTGYTNFATGRVSASLTLVARTGATTDQDMAFNAKLNNYRVTSDKQGGLVSFACDFVSDGDLVSAGNYS